MKSRIFFKLVLAFLLVILVATLALDVGVRRAWEDSLYNEIKTGLEQKVRLFAQQVEHEPQRPVSQIAEDFTMAADARATVIDASGRVLADTRAHPAEMENHATRPEFIEALHGQLGSATRTSHTVGIPFLYVAAPIQGGAVRLAYPLSSIQEMTRRVRLHLLAASGVALAIAMILAAVIAHVVSRRLKRIVAFARQVAAGDLSARLDDRSGDEVAQVAVALDQTAHKLEESFAALDTSRQQLESVLNNMPDPVFVVSREKRMQWANAPVGRIARMTPGAPLIDVFRDPSLLATVEGTLQTGIARTATATVAGRSYDVIAGPMPGGGAVTVLHDITQVERIEKTRRDFIANVSHELRTPLTSIQGYAETLLDANPDPQTAREFLEIIRKNASRMSRLTEDLLALARVESGEQRFTLRPVPAAELVQEAAESFGATASAAGVELVVKPTPDTPVVADPDAIHQVFCNLVDNALRHAAAGRKIEVGGEPCADGFEFFVRDYGPGIASEHLPRLFERFYRVDKARSREAGGTGLGLAIAKHIVRAHEGTISATSELGHGARFSFVLRLAKAGAPQSAVRV